MKSFSGILMWVLGTLAIVAVGVAILSRTPVWPYIRKS